MEVSIKCHHCNVTFDSHDEWDLHIKSGHSADDQVLISSLLALAGNPGTSGPAANVFLCGECSCEFLSSQECSNHVNSVHKKIVFENEEYPCTIKGCPSVFNNPQHRQFHESCHAESGFQCCNQTFHKWKKCSLHLWQKHHLNLDLLSCEKCPQLKFASQYQLDIHKQIHSDDKKYVCGTCDKGFSQYAQLQNHSVIHMDKTKETVPNWFAKKQCELCDKFFADSKCLKKHVQAVHSKLKPYICQVCNHQCARKAMLEMHMRQHTGDKPFKCDVCEYRTGDHNSLRRHKMRHTGEKPYKCSQCSYASIQSAAFKRHVRSKHREK